MKDIAGYLLIFAAMCNATVVLIELILTPNAPGDPGEHEQW